MSDDTMDQAPQVSTLEDSSPPPPPPPPSPQEPEGGLPDEQPNQPRSIATPTQVGTDFFRDIYFWRRKNLSFTILLAATAIWVLLEIYKFTFITLVSWIGILLFTSMFLWGYMHRLLKKEAPNMSGLEMSDQSAMKIATTIRQSIETLVKWMVHIGVEGEWFQFVGVVGVLYVISLVAKYLDFLTFLYIGVMAGLSLPMIYVKYENKIRQLGQRLRSQCERYYEVVDDKLRKMKHKLVDRQEKSKKTE